MPSGISRMKWRGKLSLEGLSAVREARHEILATITFWNAKQVKYSKQTKLLVREWNQCCLLMYEKVSFRKSIQEGQ